MILTDCKKEENNEIRVTEVKLNFEKYKLGIGGVVELVANVKPKDATNQTVKFESSKPSIATVSSDGIVGGVKIGIAIITVTTDDGDKKARCEVTIADIPVLNTKTVTSIDSYWATIGGLILNESSKPIKERGVCWSTSSYPDILK